MNESTDSPRELLRHTVATLAYRGAKVVRDVPESAASVRIGPSTRTPVEILAHVGDLLDWAHHLANGAYVWRESPVQTWDQEVERFFGGLRRLDARLAGDEPLGYPAEKIFQGPIADALTHVGQIAMLRRLAGAPVRGESYFKADIVVGRVGPEQTPPQREFD